MAGFGMFLLDCFALTRNDKLPSPPAHLLVLKVGMLTNVIHSLFLTKSLQVRGAQKKKRETYVTYGERFFL